MLVCKDILRNEDKKFTLKRSTKYRERFGKKFHKLLRLYNLKKKWATIKFENCFVIYLENRMSVVF